MKSPILLFSILASWCGAAFGSDPLQFRPGELWPDDSGVHINAHGGGILLHEGVYYWFGEHKIEGGAGNKAHVGVQVYSSKDLYQWKDEGIALAVSDDSGSPIQKECIIERPKVIYNPKTGKFVMWFHHELKKDNRTYDSSLSGVAVADTPVGPYRYLGSFRPNAGFWPRNLPAEDRRPLGEEEKRVIGETKVTGGNSGGLDPVLFLRRDFEGGQMARDMTLFVDDDGAAYLIYSSEVNATLHIARLTDDFLKTTGEYVRVLLWKYNEAPTMFKRGTNYYMITSGCTGWWPNAARLAVADSIWGPWRELGNPCRGDAEQNRRTFHSQGTYVLPAPGKKDEFIYMGDRWRHQNAIDGRYVWLPIEWEGEKPVLKWRDQWDLSVFDTNRPR